ncbi:hypothetical protein FRC02_009624 [Tulasnella sp. 418]|nr:hypothetical protein FRC02_009624 [Tulasnella sp. 418]
MYGIPQLPDYKEFWQQEDHLPQHNTSLQFPEGPKGRYLMFSNQAWGYGLNNQLQEILLLSHIAYLSNRGYVFQPYIWDAQTSSKAVLDGRQWRSSRIPLRAFISGPTAGGQFSAADHSPRSVSVQWWEKICPPERRTVLDVAEEHTRWGIDENSQGKTIMEHWSKKLLHMNDPCVEVIGPVIYDFPLIASPRILSIWPSLSSSPILTRFSWSTLVKSAVYRNLPLFYSAPSLPTPPSSSSSSSKSDSTVSPPKLPSKSNDGNSSGGHRHPPPPSLSSLNYQSNSQPGSSTNTSTTIGGLLAIHLRRGDFRIHCHWLADRLEPFAGWNQFSFLKDRFKPPDDMDGVLTRGRKHAAYMERCWPSVEQVVEKLEMTKRDHPLLDKVFVLTNGKKEWVRELKAALTQGYQNTTVVEDEYVEHYRWSSVITSRDLSILRNEREVDQAVDMEIARRAEVFIGNGFSSLTSNIVMLRLSDSTPAENIRFW